MNLSQPKERRNPKAEVTLPRRKITKRARESNQTNGGKGEKSHAVIAWDFVFVAVDGSLPLFPFPNVPSESRSEEARRAMWRCSQPEIIV